MRASLHKSNLTIVTWVDSRLLHCGPLGHDSGPILSRMIRISTQKSKSELQTKSRRTRQGGAPKCPEGSARMGFGFSTEKGLEAFSSPANRDRLLSQNMSVFDHSYCRNKQRYMLRLQRSFTHMWVPTGAWVTDEKAVLGSCWTCAGPTWWHGLDSVTGKQLGTKIQPEVFLTEVFFEPPWGHGRSRLRVMGVRTEMLVFQDFEGLTSVFAPGCPPGYPRGRPPDIQPKTYSLHGSALNYYPTLYGQDFPFLLQDFEAHQQYSSYRAIHVAIISQNSCVLVFLGAIAQLSRDMLQNGVPHRCACVELSTKRGYSTILGEC